MISKEKKNTLHIASCSFGKDSLATILLALEHGEPLDEAVYPMFKHELESIGYCFVEE